MDLTDKYKIDVSPVEDIATELVEIGLQYWSLRNISPIGEPAWTTPVKDIDTLGLGPANVVAAAAVQAILPNATCKRCGDQLRLRTRTCLSTVISGGSAHCVGCDEKLALRITAALTRPAEEAHLRREQQHLKKRQEQSKAQQEQLLREAYRRGHQLWHDRQQQAIEAEFGGGSIVDDIPSANADVELTILTLIRFAADTSPMPPLRQWHHAFPFSAGNNSGDMVNAAHGAGLIVPDVMTPPKAFEWEPQSYDQAWELAAGDLKRLPPPVRTGRYYPADTYFRIPFGLSPDTGREELDLHLHSRLTPETMTAQRQEQLLAIVFEVLRDEAVRFFISELFSSCGGLVVL